MAARRAAEAGTTFQPALETARNLEVLVCAGGFLLAIQPSLRASRRDQLAVVHSWPGADGAV